MSGHVTQKRTYGISFYRLDTFCRSLWDGGGSGTVGGRSPGCLQCVNVIQLFL